MGSERDKGVSLAVVPVSSPESTATFYVVGVHRQGTAGASVNVALEELARLRGSGRAAEDPSSSLLRACAERSEKLAEVLERFASADEALVVETRATVRSRQASKSMAKLIEALEPEIPIPKPAALLQARRNAEARAALLKEFGALTSKQVAEHAGSTAENKAAMAASWKQQGRIFSVTYRGKQLFPGFQFGPEGRPHPVIADVLRILGGEHEWQLALWFASRSGLLGGRRPVDLIESEPEAVVQAAQREAEDFTF